MHEGSRKAIAAAFLANLGIAISKFVAFLLTRSASMLAESIHSVADTGNQGLLFLGGRRASRRATPEHPFGFGRERYFWAFIVALVLFTLGGVFAITEGIGKLRNPHELESTTVAFVVLGVAIALELWSFRTAMREADRVRGGRSWWRFIRTAKAPELPVVVLEDSGALAGLLFALGGLTLAEVTGDPRYDAIGSLAIGVLLCVIAAVLAVEMKGLLIGEAADPEVEGRIVAAMRSSPGVTRLIHLRTEHLGPDELLVGAKVEFARDLTVAELAGAIDELERRVRAATPLARTIYIEPDLHREVRA